MYDKPPTDTMLAKHRRRVADWIAAAPRLGRHALAGGTRAVLDLVQPKRCAACGFESAPADGVLVCSECRSRLPPLDLRRCAACGARGGETSAAADDCQECRGRRFRFDSVVAIASYEGYLRDLVMRAKRAGEEALPLALADLVWKQAGERLAAQNCDVVVPVPAHWTTRLVRGTCPAELLAERLARRTGVPIIRRAVACRRKTRPQASLPRRRRFGNVRNAFRLRAGYDLAGARVLLVDDVLTTGATCHEVARVLRRGGASHVDVAVVARTDGGA